MRKWCIFNQEVNFTKLINFFHQYDGVKGGDVSAISRGIITPVKRGSVKGVVLRAIVPSSHFLFLPILPAFAVYKKLRSESIYPEFSTLAPEQHSFFKKKIVKPEKFCYITYTSYFPTTQGPSLQLYG
jgi:hypothetical protein